MIETSPRGCLRSMPCLTTDVIVAAEEGLIRPGLTSTCSTGPGLQQVGLFPLAKCHNSCVYCREAGTKNPNFSGKFTTSMQKTHKS